MWKLSSWSGRPGRPCVVVILKEGITLPEIVAELEGNYEKYNWLGEKKTQLVIDGVKVDIKVSTPTGIGALTFLQDLLDITLV